MKYKKRLKEIAVEIEKTMHCNCDLDNWQPLPDTGHSTVCRIHNAALEKWRNEPEEAL